MATPRPTPTDAELEILRVLWERGASTVREVHEAIGTAKDVGYTTVLKQMQVMHRSINDQLRKLQHLDIEVDKRLINCATCHRGSIDPRNAANVATQRPARAD